MKHVQLVKEFCTIAVCMHLAMANHGIGCCAVAEILRFLVSGLHDALRKAPSEAVLLDSYARVCVIISEIINEVSHPSCCRSYLLGCDAAHTFDINGKGFAPSRTHGHMHKN